MIYPEPFGNVTVGADKDYPVDYSHLDIMGDALGVKGVEAAPIKAPSTDNPFDNPLLFLQNKLPNFKLGFF